MVRGEWEGAVKRGEWQDAMMRGEWQDAVKRGAEAVQAADPYVLKDVLGGGLGLYALYHWRRSWLHHSEDFEYMKYAEIPLVERQCWEAILAEDSLEVCGKVNTLLKTKYHFNAYRVDEEEIQKSLRSMDGGGDEYALYRQTLIGLGKLICRPGATMNQWLSEVARLCPSVVGEMGSLPDETISEHMKNAVDKQLMELLEGKEPDSVKTKLTALGCWMSDTP